MAQDANVVGRRSLLLAGLWGLALLVVKRFWPFGRLPEAPKPSSAREAMFYRREDR